jgi:hypothetical protein
MRSGRWIFAAVPAPAQPGTGRFAARRTRPVAVILLGNTHAVAAFRTQVTRRWFNALRRRSRRTHVTWTRMNRPASRWLPPARVRHPFPEVRFDAGTRGAQCGSSARWDLRGGRPQGRSLPRSRPAGRATPRSAASGHRPILGQSREPSAIGGGRSHVPQAHSQRVSRSTSGH